MTASAHAASSVPALDQLIAAFKTQATGWQADLQSFALETFGILALIEIALAAFRLSMKAPDFSEIIAEIVNQMLFLGFFLFALKNSMSWGELIINSFRRAAFQAGGIGISPTDVFSVGVDLAMRIIHQMGFWHPGADAGLMIAGVVVIIAFALIAAEMILALIESYIIIGLGVLFMAFGGSRFTKDLAISTIRYTVSVGAKLFAMQMLVSIGNRMAQGWIGQFKTVNSASLCIMIGCAIVLLVLVSSIPRAIQGLVNGSHMVGSGSALVGAAAAVSAGVAASAAAMAGAPAVVGQAARLAGAQMSAADSARPEGAPPRSGVSRAAGLLAGTAGNVGKGIASDVGRRLVGSGSQHGSAPWRIGADLGNRRRLLNDDQKAPAAPSASASGPQNTIS